jgi:hypothetical protein
MQWQAWIWSCSVNGFLLACGFLFNWDDDGFACNKTMEISNLSLSQSHEYHHPDSLQLTNSKEGNKHHFLGSIEETNYLVERMVFVSVFPRRCFGMKGICIFWRISKLFKNHK